MKNIGWLYNKDYYSILTKDPKIANGILGGKSDSVKKALEEKGREIVNAGRKFENIWIDIPGCSSFRLKTLYPGLVVGTGIFHSTGLEGEAKLGMQFDHTTGLPYIPGSSVKGVLRSVFPEENQNGQGKYYAYISGIMKSKNLDEKETAELCSAIFGSKNKNDIPLSKRDIFLDASIKKANDGLLGFDFITPHKDALQNPVPIQFLKVMPGVVFQFSFRLNDTTLSSGKIVTASEKLVLFKTILLDIGIGAKTNVGYGHFESAD